MPLLHSLLYTRWRGDGAVTKRDLCIVNVPLKQFFPSIVFYPSREFADINPGFPFHLLLHSSLYTRWRGDGAVSKRDLCMENVSLALFISRVVAEPSLQD